VLTWRVLSAAEHDTERYYLHSWLILQWRHSIAGTLHLCCRLGLLGGQHGANWIALWRWRLLQRRRSDRFRMHSKRRFLLSCPISKQHRRSVFGWHVLRRRGLRFLVVWMRARLFLCGVIKHPDWAAVYQRKLLQWRYRSTRCMHRARQLVPFRIHVLSWSAMPRGLLRHVRRCRTLP
jgi:hypothetical protein